MNTTADEGSANSVRRSRQPGPTLVSLGSADGTSLRQWVDGHTHAAAKTRRRPNNPLMAHCKERRQKLEEFARARVKYYPLHAAGNG